MARSDLPFRKDNAGRFVQWLVMVLVFLSAIAATVNAYTDALLTHWSRSVVGTMTVQVPPAAEGRSSSDAARDAEKVLAALKLHPAVASAKAIPREKIVTLLEPWLGSGAAITDLPLPALIDVQLRPDSTNSAASVADLVVKAVPAALVDDHRVWLSRMTDLAGGIGKIALGLVGLIAASLAFTVIFATRASLTEFMQTIEVLHLVGARDDYIAGQFARRALTEGIVGGVLGLVLFAPTLAAVVWLAKQVQAGVLPQVELPPLHWFVLALLPFLAGLLAWSMLVRLGYD